MSFELYTNKPYVELPTFSSSSANTDGQVDLGQTQGSNNPSTSDSSSGSRQPDNSGSNNNNSSPDPVREWEAEREYVANKLRELFVNRPPRTTIFMTHPDYSNRINAWDHNVVCRTLLDARSHLTSKIIIDNGSVRYNGNLTLELLHILERKS